MMMTWVVVTAVGGYHWWQARQYALHHAAFNLIHSLYAAFSALTLLAGRQ